MSTKLKELEKVKKEEGEEEQGIEENLNNFSSSSQSSPPFSNSIEISSSSSSETLNTTIYPPTEILENSIVPTLYIYAILQRLSPKIDKYKYMPQLFFNYLTHHLTTNTSNISTNDLKYNEIKDWILKKLDLDINNDEINYLLQYLQIRLADPSFDSNSSNIFKSPSSRYYPRWSNKLKSIVIKYQVPITIRKSNLSTIQETKQQINFPTLRRAQSLQRKSSKIENNKTSKLSPSSPPPSSPPPLPSSSSSSSLIETRSRLPQMKATTQHVQELMQEQKEMSKHISKIFHSKNIR